MLYATGRPSERRAALRAELASGRLLRFPGAFNPLSAKLIEDKGFDGVYISGAVIAADLGLPDVGLTTLSEVSAQAGQISRMTTLPTIVDADTGFGEPMNAARAIRAARGRRSRRPAHRGPGQSEAVRPPRRQVDRRRGHGRAAHPISRLRSARREPSRHRPHRHASRRWPRGRDRARQIVGAGADIVFPEALTDLSEFEAVRAAIDVPIVANMTEFGQSELFTTQQLADVGVNIVIFPVSLLRLAMGAAERGLDTLNAEGSLQSVVPTMQTRVRLYDLLDYEAYNTFDQSIFNFSTPGAHDDR